MAYYYINSNDQDYPVNNYTYYNQPYYNNDHHNNFYNSSSSYAQEYEYGYSNDPTIRYDQYSYDTQFHSNPYQHIPTESLIVYHHNPSTYDNLEFPSKKVSNFPDLDVSTGFVISYSNTQPTTDDLDIEEFQLEPYHGGYNISETYGKPLPASEEICYPPSKIDPIPPPSSPFGKGGQNPETPAVKEAEKQASESDEGEDEEEREKEGILIAPALPGKEDRIIDQGGAKPANENEALDEEQASDSEEDEEEEEEKMDSLDGGRIEEKVIRRLIPPGYGLEAYDLCEGVFGGYFPCLRKRNLSQEESGNNNNNMSFNNEDANGDCWKFTMDYLFGGPDPYARAQPDPVYGYQRHCPQEPLWEQVEYGGTYSISMLDNPSYYYDYNNLS